MASPAAISAAVEWGMKAAWGVIPPVISTVLREGFSYLGIDASEKLRELELKVMQLEMMLGRDAVRIFPHRHLLEPLLKNLKSAFCQAEDMLDDLEYHRLERHILSLPDDKRNWVEKLQSPLPKCFCLKHQESGISKGNLKKSLKKIEEIINDACKILEQLNLPSVSNANGSRAVASNSGGANTRAAPPAVIIGQDKDRDTIIAMLHENEGDGQPNNISGLYYSVIGIHGISGSGKSTLAQSVCAREKEDKQREKEGHFDLVMWVQVSENFSLKTVFSKMLEEATGVPWSPFNNINTLQDDLERKLHGKRFLLVLDDVWYKKDESELELEKILSPLIVGEAGSKILVTSRNTDALSTLGAVKCIPISDLDDNDFLKLFMHYALEGTTVDNQDKRDLEMIGADIARKLKKSPLAARAVGGQLRIRPSIEFWRRVRDQDLLNDSTGALWWSYQHLDEEVRRCFAYCSIFPKRHHFYCDELVKLWVAEGFISTNEGEEMQDVCRGYFDELVSTSFLQLGGKDKWGNKECYFVHDLMHDLAEKVTGNDCFRIENGWKWTSEGWRGDVWTGEVPRDVRHLFVLSYDRATVTENIFEMENLRTLIINSVECTRLVEENVLESTFARLRKLRVLHILIREPHPRMSRRQDMFSVPASIGQLRHLRYLAFQPIGHQFISTELILPGTLTKLYHMQLLDFSCVKKLAFACGEEMNNLINLQHLICFQHPEFPNIGRLTSLRTLRFFKVRNQRGYELKQLRDLNKLRGRLHIRGLENVESKAEALEANLADKKQLTELVLEWKYDSSCNAEVQVEILEGLCPPMSLGTLRIFSYSGTRNPDWMVGKQKGGPMNLHELDLFGCRVAPEVEAFIHLRSLSLSYCIWDTLPDNMEHLTSLRKLRIDTCLNIRSLPTLPQSLEEFTLDRCNEVFMRSCVITGHPNWKKIEHIAKKVIKEPY